MGGTGGECERVSGVRLLFFVCTDFETPAVSL